jgi:hypothetical protein
VELQRRSYPWIIGGLVSSFVFVAILGPSVNF